MIMLHTLKIDIAASVSLYFYMYEVLEFLETCPRSIRGIFSTRLSTGCNCYVLGREMTMVK